MSYCRFGPDSDVYVYESVSGGWDCCGCHLLDYFNAGTPGQMIDHLLAHREAGHSVPQRAIDRLADVPEAA